MSKLKESLSSLDYSISPRQALVGSQMFFVAFGALVLVPLLTGLNPNVAMFTAGIGTLAFQIITKGSVPIFLASSFAFIMPISLGVERWGLPATLCGLAASGVLYMALSLLVKLRGVGIIQRFLPAIVTGPVIMVIGLSLAPVAVNMAFGLDSNGKQAIPRDTALIVAMISLGATVVATIWGKGILKLIPIFCGIVAGYAASLFFGLVDFTPIYQSPWFAIPQFVAPQWNLEAIIFIVPIAIAPAIEHVGNIIAIGAVTGRDYLEKPGLQRTLLGDGVATSLAAIFGGPPNTTYSEVTGGVALTRAFNPAVMTWAAVTAIALAFVAKLGAVLSTIPGPVMGGIMILLFGTIAVVGINSLSRSNEDLMDPRNMVIMSVVLVFGLGGMVLQAGDFTLMGIGLAGISGFVLNVILPGGHSASTNRLNRMQNKDRE